MTHRERVLAAIRGEAVDHAPIALWRHFPGDDRQAETLASAHITFQETYRFDLLKVTPASGYYGDDWGLGAEYRPSREGVRTYVDRPIKKAADWRSLTRLDVKSGVYGRELHALSLIRKGVGKDLHILPTIFSPLSIARTLAGEDALIAHLRQEPAHLKAGLEVIADTTRRFSLECLAAGADGIFLASQMAREDLLTQEEYLEFGKPHDLQILEAVSGSEVILLHTHGEGIYFHLFNDYPVGIINWHDRRTPPTLGEAREQTPRCLAGGINERAFGDRGPGEVTAEVREALSQTGGKGHLVAAGCVLPVDSPDENIRAALQAARGE